MNKQTKMSKENLLFDKGPAIYTETIASKHTVSMSRLLADPEEFDDVVNLLRTAGELDHITFLLNNHGGSVDVLLPLINFLEMTSAHTLAMCTGSQSSAATIFAIYCDDLVAMDHSEFMIHEMQAGTIGTMSNVERSSQSLMRRNARLVKEAYGGFLTEQEIQDVLRGVEIYLDDDEINRRFPLRQEWRENFYSAKQAAFEAKIQESIDAVQAQMAEVEEQLEAVKPAKKAPAKKAAR